MTRAMITAALLVAVSPAFAQSGDAAKGRANAFPGGASALNETYDDWIVGCTRQTDKKICTLSQQLAQRGQDGANQRVLSIELAPNSARGVSGAIVLPFGLLLEKGATLQLDDSQPQAPTSIRTCLPAGCVAPISMDAKLLGAVRKAKQLKVNLVASDSGSPLVLNVSLKGFDAALDRVEALLR